MVYKVNKVLYALIFTKQIKITWEEILYFIHSRLYDATYVSVKDVVSAKNIEYINFKQVY